MPVDERPAGGWLARLRPRNARSAAARRTVLWLFALGFVVRFLYFVEHSGSAFYRVPILDEAFYDTVARALVSGDEIASINPAFRPLFYPSLLAAAYGFGGEWGWSWALGAQHALGIVTALLIALTATRLFDRPLAGALGGGLYLLAGPPLFFEGELLITSLFTALGAALLAWLSMTRVDGPAWRWLVAGLLVGLMAQARANALVLAAAFPIVALWTPRASSGVARRLALAALAGAGILTSLSAFALWQKDYVGRFQLVPGAGGVNLYLGNKRGADGMVPRQDAAASYGDRYQDSVQLFSVAEYRARTGSADPDPEPSAVSRFWLRQTLEEIRADPVDWILLMARKSLLLVWNREIPNNKSYSFIASEESRLLGLMPVRFWLLLALAGVGVLAVGRRRQAREEPFLWLALYLALLGGAVILFFITARYRLPLWPALAVLGGGGAATLATALRGDASMLPARRRLPALALALALAGLSLINWLGIPPIEPHRDYFFRSIALFEKGRFEEALRDARASMELQPGDAGAHFQLAAVALELERLDLAERHNQRALRLAREEPRVFNQLGVILERRGRVTEAYQSSVRATELGPAFSPAWTNASRRARCCGRRARERRHAARAEKRWS
ncbi:MAG: hypothetical protein AAF725_25280, partial [Acidobacteriota bacterium]